MTWEFFSEKNASSRRGGARKPSNSASVFFSMDKTGKLRGYVSIGPDLVDKMRWRMNDHLVWGVDKNNSCFGVRLATEEEIEQRFGNKLHGRARFHRVTIPKCFHDQIFQIAKASLGRTKRLKHGIGTVGNASVLVFFADQTSDAKDDDHPFG